MQADLSCTLLAHLELESILNIITYHQACLVDRVQERMSQANKQDTAW